MTEANEAIREFVQARRGRHWTTAERERYAQLRGVWVEAWRREITTAA